MLLIHVGQLHRLAHLEGACVRLLQPHDEAEEGGLARTVRAYHAHDAVRRQHEVEVAEQHLVAVGLRHTLGLQHLVAQARAVGDEYLQLLLAFLLLLVEHSIVRIQTCLTLSLTSLRSHAYPLQLALQGLLALRGGLLLLCHALSLLVKP